MNAQTKSALESSEMALLGLIGKNPVIDRALAEIRQALRPANEAENFIAYLENQLIPDLKESGYEGTQQDFETLIAFYRDK